jgi:hypothetical protein
MPFLKALALASVAFPLASATNPKINNGMPPERFRGDVATVVIFTDRAGIGRLCGIAQPPYTIIACAGRIDGTPVIVMPNPCPLGDSEIYAKVMCHEMAHINGWPATHGD